MRKIVLLSALLAVFFGISTKAQVTVTGDGAGGSPYATLQAAIAALPATLTQNTVISVDPGNPQNAPAGGYSITTTGTASFSLTITGNSNTVTAPTPQTAGALNDAIFKIIGGDFITIQGFSMLENAANTTTTAASNNMTEWGVAVLYASTTNGAQNVTIQNNTITLVRTYQNSFGIYSNSTHSATAPTTSATATSVAGNNSGLKIYNNTISNVNNGIVVVGPTGAANYNTGVEIGGASLGNSVTNYGTTGTFSGYANVSGTVNGILLRNSNGFVVSNNTVNSSVGGVTSGTLNGIQIAAASATPTGTFTNNINNNSISLQPGAAGSGINGINHPSGSATATSSININNNNFSSFGHTVAGTAAINFIIQSSTHQNTAISNNTFTNITCNTTGSVTFISSSITVPANGTQNINGNSIVTQFSKTGAGGTVTLFTNNGSSGATVTEQINNNNFSNITVTGATTIAGFSQTDGGSPVKTVTGNTFSNWVGGTSSITALVVSFSGVGSTVSNNTVSNISSAGSITGISSSSGNQTFTGNNVFGLTSTGAFAVTGISNSGGTAQVYSKNRICNLEANNTLGSVNGILISLGTTITLANNRIADLRTPIADAANPLNGINITGGTAVNLYFNTVYLNASSTGLLFGSSAISAATSVTLELNNNIFHNASSQVAAGLATAYRRSSTTLTSYAPTSNRNNFFGSTIFTDGTNTDATIGAYQTRVASRDVSSFSENSNFLSTVCGNSDFLKINTTIVTQLEGGGAPAGGIADDFEGDTRNASTPDVGADEFNGASPVPVIVLNSITPAVTQCTATARVISVTVTTPAGTVTGVTISFNNGTANNNVAMTNTSGNIWEYTIPAASPSNTNVTWSITATNSATLTTVYVGANYQDDPLFGGVGSATATPLSVCTGSTSSLQASFFVPAQSITVGTGGSSSSTTAATFLPGGWGGAKTQYIIRASELTAAGLAPGNFTSLSFETTNSGQTYQGFAVSLGTTAQTDMTSTFIASALTQVYKGTLTDDGYTPLVGVNTLAFGTGAGSSTSFTWDGSSNIVVSICWSSVPNATNSNSTSMIVVPAGYTSSAYEQSDNSSPATMCAKTVADGTGTNRPKFTFVGNKLLSISSVSWNDGISNIGSGNPFVATVNAATTYTPTGTDANGCTLVGTGVSVTTIALPTAPGAGTFPSFQCGTAIPAEFVSGGTTGQYRWYTVPTGGTAIAGETDDHLLTTSISTTTTFYVAITDGTCESIRTAVIANVTAADLVTAGVDDNTPCPGVPISLSVTQTGSNQNYTYTWKEGLTVIGTGNPLSHTPLTAGLHTYTVEAVDGGCFESSTVNITAIDPPSIDSISATPDTICSGGSSQLYVSWPPVFADAFAEPFESFPVSSFTTTGTGVTFAGNTSYFVQGAAAVRATYTNDADGSLAMTSGVNLTGLTNPQLKFSHICATESSWDYGIIEYSTDGGASWLGFPSTAYAGSPSALEADILPSIGFDANSYTDWGAQFTSSSSVYPAAPATSLWKAETINLSAYTSSTNFRVRFRLTSDGSAIYAGWSIDDVKISYEAPPTITALWDNGAGSGATVPVTPGATTTYTVTLTDAATTCTSDSVVVVTVLELPDAPVATNSQQCGTGVPTASVATGGANGNGVFHWYLVPTGGTAIAGENGTSLVTYTISTPTSFYVSETGTNGCESPRTQVDVTFDLIPDDLTLSASPSPICLGSSTTFTVGQTGGSNSFIFNYPSLLHAAGSGINIPNVDGVDSSLLDASITITPTAAGTYTYTVRGFDPDKGCVSIATTTVVVNPIPAIPNTITATPSTICEGAQVVLSYANLGSQTPPTGYCASAASATTEDDIGQVSFAGILNPAVAPTPQQSNSSATNTYTDFTSVAPATVVPGSTYPVTIYQIHGTTDESDNFCNVYIDFDRDGDFSDANEVFALSKPGLTFLEDFVGNITIPANAQLGLTRMRVILKEGAITTLCGTVGTWGEVEDYLVNITGATPGTYTWNGGAFTGNNVTVTPSVTTDYYLSVTNLGCNNTASTPVTVTVNPLPVAPTSGGNVTRCGPGAVSLSATGTGGTLNWYNVASGGTSLVTGGSYSPNVTASTSFWVAETSAAGCEGPRTEITVTVTAAPALTITPSGATTFCQGDFVQLDADGTGYVNFAWTPATGLTNTIADTTTAAPLVTTTYTVTADDGSPTGCANTATITITVNPNPVIDSVSANPASICVGSSSTLTAYASVSGPAGLPATYCVPLSSGGSLVSSVQFGSINNSVTQTTPFYNIYPASGATTTSVLRGQTYTLAMTSSTASIASVWIDFDRNGTFDATEWQQVWTSASSGSISITIPLTATPGQTGMRIRTRGTGSPNGDVDACTQFFSGSAQDYTISIVDAANYTYLWSNSATGASTSVSPTTTTAYTVTASSVAGCTTVSSPVSVQVLPVGANATAALSTLCAGASTLLSANGTGGQPLTYSWNILDSVTVLGTNATLSVTPATTTTYQVTVTDACSNTATSQVTITVNALPVVTVSPTTASVCNPGASPVALSAGGAVSYAWSPATGLSAATGAAVSASPLNTTSYVVTGTDANNCTATATAVITVNPAVQNLVVTPAAVTICEGTSTALTASASAFGLAGGYQFAFTTGAALDPMSGAVVIVSDSTDDAPMNMSVGANTTAGNGLPIGFDFNFNGTYYNHFAASPDGWVRFANTNAAPGSQFSNGVTSTTNIPKIYPYWDDLSTGGAGQGGNVSYVVTGTAPNRILVVQWFVTIPRAVGGAPNSTFQAWMYETTGKVEFRYGTMNTGSMSASVGITGSATQYRSVTVSTNLSSSSSANNSNSGQPASGTMYTFNIPAVTNFAWTPGSLTGATVNVSPVASQTYTVTATATGGCTATATSDVTVNPKTVVTTDVAPSTQFVPQNGAPTALTFVATGTGTVTQQWYSNTTNSTTGGTLVGGETATSFTPPTTTIGTTYYYAVASSDCGSDTTSAAEVIVLTTGGNVWTAAAGTTNWHTAGNWSQNAVPSTLSDVLIPTVPSGSLNFPALTSNAVAKSVQVDATATLTLAGFGLTVGEGVSGAGSLVGSNTSNLTVGAASTLRFTALGGTLRNLTINGTGTSTLASALDITGGSGAINNNTYGTVTIASGAVLASGGNLTFKSNASGSARLAAGASSGQWITGNVTVERYIPANAQRAWRFLSVPTKGLQTIKQAWQEGATPANMNPKPGFGTRITTPQLQYSALGFDERTSKASIQFFNQASGASGAWVDVSSTLAGGNRPQIESVKGYSLYIRGERTQTASSAVTATTPTVLRTTGELYTGNQAAITVGSGRFDLIGNTYVSAIDFLGLTRTNLVNSFYLWDPKLVVGTAPNISLGGYVTFSLTNGFVGVPNNSSYGITPRSTIQAGESFMIQANSGGGSIALNESAKVVGDGVNFYRPASPTTGFEKLKANLLTVATDNSTVMADANVSVFDNAFANAVDGDDAVKLTNAGENFAIRRSNTNLVVEGRQVTTSSDTTNFWMWNLRQNQQYRLELITENMNVAGRTAFLIDNFTNTTTQLDLAGGLTNYDFTISAEPLSSVSNRFRIVYRQVQLSPVPVSFVSVTAQPAGAAIRVNWKVAQESGIKQYVIERSADGRNFTASAAVAASGNRGGEVSYAWLDATPLTGGNFYRIKSLGLGGEIKYSPVVKVLTGNILPSFTIAPNPVEGSIVNIQFKNQLEGRYALRLLALTGETVFTAVKEHTGGTSTQVVELPSTIARGAYQLEIISPDKVREVQTLFINTLK